MRSMRIARSPRGVTVVGEVLITRFLLPSSFAVGIAPLQKCTEAVQVPGLVHASCILLAGSLRSMLHH
jgi:hypothetical protein